jgi:benzoate-CoA ligase family protein
VNLVEYVFQAARKLNRWPEAAIVCEDRRVTYEELLRLVKKCARVIRALGLEAGDRVGVVAADCPEWIISFLGIVAAGAVAVPASTMLTAGELQYILNHCGAKLLIITSEQLEKVRSIRGNLPQLENILLIDGEAEAALDFNATLAGADEALIEPVNDEALAFILYTSGSTGQPKGAMHLHRNLPYTVEYCCKHVLRVEPEDRLFSSSRLFFAYGLGNSLSFPLGSGATSVLCRERPIPPVIARVFKQARPTIFFAVPAVFRALIEYASQEETLETNSIKFCVSAGEKLPERIFHEWKKLTGLDILDGIGSTEMLQMFITNTRDRIVPGSSGRVVPGYWAKLVDHEGREITGACTGHLMIKGGSASPGYWNDPLKTAATMQGEWMRTGDLYRRDEDGNFWHEGRSDDLFKVKGLWVSPIEVEEALLSCKDVLEAAVVPGVDRNGMSMTVAYVVLRSRSLSEEKTIEGLKSEVSRRLPSYKCPTEIYLATELPRTATGKLQRFKLRKNQKAGASPSSQPDQDGL